MLLLNAMDFPRDAPNTTPATTSSFLHEPTLGGWICPHCAMIPFHLRAPGSFCVDHPSFDFVERHYTMCTGLKSLNQGTYEASASSSCASPSCASPSPYAASYGPVSDLLSAPGLTADPNMLSQISLANSSIQGYSTSNHDQQGTQRSQQSLQSEGQQFELLSSHNSSIGTRGLQQPGRCVSLSPLDVYTGDPPSMPGRHTNQELSSQRQEHQFGSSSRYSPAWSQGLRQQNPQQYDERTAVRGTAQNREQQIAHQRSLQQQHERADSISSQFGATGPMLQIQQECLLQQLKAQQKQQAMQFHSMLTQQQQDGQRTGDMATQMVEDRSCSSAATSEGQDAVVSNEDKSIITDYIFFVHQQLKLCRFTEDDRKIRGGKRDNIKVGYGGLECRHCASDSKSRKFFWSNVDRLANSFAEIPGHLMKCPKCPDEIKAKLKELKLSHSYQIANFPRGSQKIFFRRMWRRLHDHEDTVSADGAHGVAALRSSPSPLYSNDGGISPEIGTYGRDMMTIDGGNTLCNRSVAPFHHTPRVLLAIADDRKWLSDMDCFVRNSLEVFCANEANVIEHHMDKKYPIKVGQVGIRCIYCASSPSGARGMAVSYPYSIKWIYKSVRDYQQLHLPRCPHLPSDKRDLMKRLNTAGSLPSVLKRYYGVSAKTLGMYDTSDGIRAEGGRIPMDSGVYLPSDPTQLDPMHSRSG